jgi:hypothetical protein
MEVFIRNYPTNPEKQPEYYGIDIINDRNSKSEDSCDLYCKQYRQEKYPIRLVTNLKGGIIPIYENDQITSTAPVNGYVQDYLMAGQEKGFYIRCRDGKSYARLTVASPQIDRTTPISHGYILDYIIRFNVLFQANSNIFNHKDFTRLDYFILENL